MNYQGPNAEAVNEVIAYFHDGPLLTVTGPPRPRIIRCKTFLDDQCGPGGKPFDDLLDGEQTFVDIRETEAGAFYGRYFELFEQLQAITSVDDDGMCIIGRRLPPPCYKFAYDISIDFCFIATSRAAFGVAPGRVFEGIFDAYRSGGIPCGYVGEWPDRLEILTFFPGPEMLKRQNRFLTYEDWWNHQ